MVGASHLLVVSVQNPSKSVSDPRYLVLSQRHRVEQDIEKSRFITTIARASTAEEARAFVDEVRREFPDATHNCWAFSANPPGESLSVGMSDDGEPSGTAGRPMLQVLQHAEVGEIAAVVTRYYGGVKLGTGGLVRAYTSSVQQALASAPTVPFVTYKPCQLLVDYSDHGRIQRALPAYEVKIVEEVFTDRVRFELQVPSDRFEQLCVDIPELTNGRVVVAVDASVEGGD